MSQQRTVTRTDSSLAPAAMASARRISAARMSILRISLGLTEGSRRMKNGRKKGSNDEMIIDGDGTGAQIWDGRIGQK